MAQKRLTRKFSEVVSEVRDQIISSGLANKKQLEAWKNRAQILPITFPHSTMVAIEDMWIDYEVQRDVIYKHVLNIMKKWDPRICSPGSACCIKGDPRIMLYDAQHRTLAAALLGFTKVPCAVVHTDDPNFPSYAFELLNDTGVKRLNPGDLHRNNLVRYKNGSRDLKVVKARKMQDQFDKADVDLQDKNSRASATLCGDNLYFFSHFKYAQKVMEANDSGKVLYDILNAIKTVFPNNEEIDQGVFIGLYELYRIGDNFPKNWMITLLESISEIFPASNIIHSKAKLQWEHSRPGATWSAPEAMSNFMRELHVISGGTLPLAYHGEGSKIGVEEGNIAPGLIPTTKKVVA